VKIIKSEDSQSNSEYNLRKHKKETNIMITPEVRKIVEKLISLNGKDYHSTKGVFGTSIRKVKKAGF